MQRALLIHPCPIMLHRHMVELGCILSTIDSILYTVHPLRWLEKEIQPETLGAHIKPMLEITTLLG